MKIVLILSLVIALSGCFEFPGADQKFGKQNFVSSISIIELHKTRTGVYPNTLRDLKYLGDWDQIWLQSVKYEKVENGYNLFVVRGYSKEPDLEMPEGFKEGLGLMATNVKWIKE